MPNSPCSAYKAVLVRVVAHDGHEFYGRAKVDNASSVALRVHLVDVHASFETQMEQGQLVRMVAQCRFAVTLVQRAYQHEALTALESMDPRLCLERDEWLAVVEPKYLPLVETCFRFEGRARLASAMFLKGAAESLERGVRFVRDAKALVKIVDCLWKCEYVIEAKSEEMFDLLEVIGMSAHALKWKRGSARSMDPLFYGKYVEEVRQSALKKKRGTCALCALDCCADVVWLECGHTAHGNCWRQWTNDAGAPLCVKCECEERETTDETVAAFL